MSMTISRKSAGVSRLKGLLKEPLMLQGFYVPSSRDGVHYSLVPRPARKLK